MNPAGFVRVLVIELPHALTLYLLICRRGADRAGIALDDPHIFAAIERTIGGAQTGEGQFNFPVKHPCPHCQHSENQHGDRDDDHDNHQSDQNDEREETTQETCETAAGGGAAMKPPSTSKELAKLGGCFLYWSVGHVPQS